MKTFFGRKFKKKKIKASVLAVTLIVLGMGIVIGLSAALVSIQQRRSSIGEGSSSRVFQSAESGVENAQKAMKEVSLAIGSGATVADLVSEIGSSSCDTATGLIEMGDNNYVELQRSDGSQISCASSTVSLKEVNFVRSSGEDGVNQRSVRATLRCVGANIVNDLIGHWKFDNNLEDSNILIPKNNAENCDASNYTSSNPPATTIDGSAPGYSSVGRPNSYIIFNDGGRNCAVIKDVNDYHLSEGTVSFWTYYRGDPFGTGNGISIFKKDARDCDTRCDSNDPADDFASPGGNTECYFGPIGNNPECDCGHLGFHFNYPTLGKLGIRFQNDGNIHHYFLTDRPVPASPAVNWSNEWHLLTLTFNLDEYILYEDGEKVDSFRRTSPTDSNGNTDPDAAVLGFEGMLNNDWNIFLGASYPDDSSPPSWSDQKVNMDDLRIYKRALSQCDAEKLYIETQ